LVIKFKIHGAVLLVVTPFQPGPTNFSSDNLWQLPHLTPKAFSPLLERVASNVALG